MSETPRKPGTALVVVNQDGREPEYSEEIAAYICKRRSCGDLLADICSGPGMPHVSTVRGWSLDDMEALDMGKPSPYPNFATRYARANLMGIEAEMDEVRRISDTPLLAETVTIKETKDGVFTEIRRSDATQRAALMLSARQWRIDRVLEKTTGPRSRAETLRSVEDGQGPKVRIIGGLPEDDE